MMALSDIRTTATATIALNGSLSAAINLGGYRVAAIVMPAAWDTAAITFQGSHDGSTFQDVYNDAGTELSLTTAASRNVALRADAAAALRPFGIIKVRSGTAGSPVTQTAARTLTLILVPALT